MKLRPLTMHLTLGFSLLLVSGVSTRADEKIPGVSLMLSKVAARRDSQGTEFHCQVTIDNHTGKEIAVTSSFFSVFDGLELVVTNIDGKVLKQQHYTFHQSPFTPNGREFILKHGTTKKSIVFPVTSFGMVGQSLKVRLVGTLPGSSYKRILSTDTIKTQTVAATHAPNSGYVKNAETAKEIARIVMRRMLTADDLKRKQFSDVILKDGVWTVRYWEAKTRKNLPIVIQIRQKSGAIIKYEDPNA